MKYKLQQKLEEQEQRILELENRNCVTEIIYKSGLPFLVMLIGLVLVYYNFQYLKIPSCTKEACNFSITDTYPFIMNYLFVSLTSISFCATLKGGYNKIKSINEQDLISGLISGLIIGLISGLINEFRGDE